jgi:hypothetical protein
MAGRTETAQVVGVQPVRVFEADEGNDVVHLVSDDVLSRGGTEATQGFTVQVTLA